MSFDVREPFQVRILSGIEKNCTVKYPSDKQWADLAGKKKSKRPAGQAFFEDAGNHAMLDFELLMALMIEGDKEQFDEYEAAKIIGLLSKTGLESADRDGDRIVIELRVFGGALVKHTLKVPTLRDVGEYERVLEGQLDRKGTRAEWRPALGPGAALWDRLRLEASGYADGSDVPIVHKVAALSELLKFFRDQDPE